MKKLATTTFALAIAISSAAGAHEWTDPDGNVHHGHKCKYEHCEAKYHNHTQYTEVRIGDPRINYSEIGTNGAQNGNTIIPMYGEPVVSTRPYEIRYDYAEFR